MSEITIHYNNISQQLKIRPEILKKLIKSFSLALLDKMKILETALASNDATQMRAVLHEIKGTAGNLRLSTICTAENVMHEAVKGGEKKEKLAEYLKVLQERVAELQQYTAKQEI